MSVTSNPAGEAHQLGPFSNENNNIYESTRVSGHATLIQGNIQQLHIAPAIFHRRKWRIRSPHKPWLKCLGFCSLAGSLLAMAVTLAVVFGRKSNHLVPRPRPDSSANIPSVVIDAVAWYRHRVFYLDRQTGGILGATTGRGNGYEAHGLMTGLRHPLSMSNSLALAYYLYGSQEQTKLYFIEAKYSQIIELTLSCPVLSPCDITGDRVLPAVNVSSTSNLALVRYSALPRIFIYYINTNNEIAAIALNYYKGGEWQPSQNLGVSVYPGSNLATTMTSLTPPQFAIYYFDPMQRLAVVNVSDTSPYANTTHVLYFNTTSTTPQEYTYKPTANLAVTSLPISGYNAHNEIRIYRPSEDGLHLEEFISLSAKDGGYIFSPSGLGVEKLRPLDDVYSSGFGPKTWWNDDGGCATRMWYPSNGALVGCGQDTNDTYTGSWYQN